MGDRIRFYLNRLGERLWVRPLLMCLVSIAGVFVAKTADIINIGPFLPEITLTSIETLLNVISASMLVIATFSVGSMVSAYASASSTATPRSFALVIADDVSQNALSAFIGAFIFSIVALVALQNNFYDKAGRFALFTLTIIVFAIVILTFVRWVDSIARLGRLGATVDQVEEATAAALRRRRSNPFLGGTKLSVEDRGGREVYGKKVGYVQRVEINALQACAEQEQVHIAVAALPGTFLAPGRALAYVVDEPDDVSADIDDRIANAFVVGDDRKFDEDPRFGLIVLSEIASRALSPAVNDPGTAIDIIGTLVRLFVLWQEPLETDESLSPDHDRVAVPELVLSDLFNDAFSAIARDGAGTIEVVVRLLKAFAALAETNDQGMQILARQHARLARARAETAMAFPEDIATVRRLTDAILSPTTAR